MENMGLVNIIMGLFATVIIVAGMAFPLMGAWTALRAKGPRWDNILAIAFILAVMPPLIVGYSNWLLSSINEAIVENEIEMEELFRNTQRLISRDWLGETVLPTIEPFGTTIFIVEDLISSQLTNTPRPMILPTRTAVPQATIFVCQMASDIALGCLAPTPEVMK